MTQRESLYYECHITIEPVFGERLEEAKKMAEVYKFKVADLLMKKRADDTLERSANDTFMTGHDHKYKELEERMVCMIHWLRVQKFVVWRYKIEDVVLDSRINDELNLLGKVV